MSSQQPGGQPSHPRGNGGQLRRVLVLGLDGASFDVIEPLARAGRLPNLARWMEEGASLPLRSTVPAMSFPAWSTLATGLDPGRHGLFDFTQKLPGAYRIRFSNATDRGGETLFSRVSRAGARVLCLGMPATFPPEPVNGLLVSGFDAPISVGSDARSASDPTLYNMIAAKIGPWMTSDWMKRRRTATGTSALRCGCRNGLSARSISLSRPSTSSRGRLAADRTWPW